MNGVINENKQDHGGTAGRRGPVSCMFYKVLAQAGIGKNKMSGMRG